MTKISPNLQIPQQIAQYLQSHSQETHKESIESIQQVFLYLYSLLIEKDNTIMSLQSQITRYKAQSIKTNKTITQLQQKISSISPNANNTGSNFMMGSEFKEYFQDFFNNTLVNVMTPLAAYPEAYWRFIKEVFQEVHEGMSHDLQMKMKNICKILNLEESNANVISVRLSLLKLLQDNSHNLFSCSSTQASASDAHSFFKRIYSYLNPQLVEIAQSSQLPEFEEKLLKICSYMILQEKPWHFIIPSETKIQKYNKKQYHCIDGWVKQKDEVIVLLEGLAKGDDWKHPNLKNFVIPYAQSQEQFVFLSKSKEAYNQSKQNNHNQSIKIPQLQRELHLQNSPKIYKQQKAQKIDNFSQYSPRQSLSPKTKKPKKLRRVLQQKQNEIPSNIQSSHSNIKNQNSLSFTLNRDLSCGNVIKNKTKSIKETKNVNKQDNKVKQNFVFSSNFNLENPLRKVFNFGSVQSNVGTQRTSVLADESVQPQFGFIMSPHYINHPKDTHKLQNDNIESVCANPSVSIKKSSKLKNSSKISHNLISDPSFQEIVALPYKKKDMTDQLPLKRQSSRTKKSSSRKTSVGKIVGQAIQHKENQMSKNNREQLIRESTKQSLYKDMIKQKLGSDHRVDYKTDQRLQHKYEHKVDNSIKGEQKCEKIEQNHKTERQKGRQSKNKYKQEDRPLRIMHFKKIREKYLNL